MKNILFAVLVVSGSAMAADPVKLNCAAGSKQVSDGEGLFCSRGGAPGIEKLDGPYVGLNKNGTVESQGQYLNGNRTGRWTFFDEKGVKIQETDFVNDEYHGKRITWLPDGQKQEETWVAGRLQATSVPAPSVRVTK